MIMYKARLTERFDREAAQEGVSIAPILESAALDEYGSSWSVLIHDEGGDECSFSFLAVDAPRVLAAGDEFTLREGGCVVARGTIVEVCES